MITKKYELSSNKIKKDVNIALFSDIHYSNIISTKKLKKITDNLIQNNPDFICIAGDIIDNNNILDNKPKMKIFYDWLISLTSIAPTIIILGNHDFYKLTYQRFSKKLKYKTPTKMINTLKKIPNLYLLNNKGITINNINFHGYQAPVEYYKYNKIDKIRESNEILINDFNQKMKIENNDNYNVLLFHSPIRIFNDECFKEISDLNNMDLVLTGHMHNGLVPNFLERIIPKNYGIIGPFSNFFPKYARGIITKNKKNNMIISGGITKFAESNPKFMLLFNHFYKPEIDYIKLKKLS
jgi:predicted MPP superfamily phosphohydrolase